jgi:hypothetical protein
MLRKKRGTWKVLWTRRCGPRSQRVQNWRRSHSEISGRDAKLKNLSILASGERVVAQGALRRLQVLGLFYRELARSLLRADKTLGPLTPCSAIRLERP